MLHCLGEWAGVEMEVVMGLVEMIWYVAGFSLWLLSHSSCVADY